VELFRWIQALDARKTLGLSGAMRPLVGLARAALPIPDAAVLLRDRTDALLAAADLPALDHWLDPRRPDVVPEAVSEAAASLRDRPVPRALSDDVARLVAQLHEQGAQTFVVSAAFVCDQPSEDRALGRVQLGLVGKDVAAAVRDALAAAYDVERLRELRDRHVTSAGVCVLVQRMIEGDAAGVLFTRHPLMRDEHEWLLRAGFGLASAIRRGLAPSDVWRTTRLGHVRDAVVVDKHAQVVVTENGERTLREVPEAQRRRPALTQSQVAELLKIAARAERQIGSALRLDFAVAEGRAYIVRVDADTDRQKPRKIREGSGQAERDLWSSRELSESVPDVLTPLTWSLLRRFSRLGLVRALGAFGANVGETALVTEVRGHAYVNIGALTQAICRLPFVSPSALASVGLEPALDVNAERASPLGIARAALAIYDSQWRFGRRIERVKDQVRGERSHFLGLDPRLLSPDAVERVLCDVELWMRDSGEALMRCYGLWLTSLVALRAVFVDHMGDDALRLEQDLLWGAAEIAPVSSAEDMLSLSRTLASDREALHWAESAGPPPRVVTRALYELALRHRQLGMVLMDPSSPRWLENLPRLGGALRLLLADPMARAFAVDRVEIARGRRERAEREWRRRVPFSLWPVALLLIKRVRELTKAREQLLSDAAQAIFSVREIALDASRRMSFYLPDAPADAAFFLELSELHVWLAEGSNEMLDRMEQRRTEHAIQKALPPAASRFALRVRAAGDGVEGNVLRGIQGSTGAGEGRVVRVTDGSELESLPRAAVLVVQACDVGLAPVLPAVRAVISEAGGLLSHGTMLGSALGLPVVVGVEGALARLVDGARVRVDADRAEVTILDGST
jgi:pyruvate,water dikinase